MSALSSRSQNVFLGVLYENRVEANKLAEVAASPQNLTLEEIAGLSLEILETLLDGKLPHHEKTLLSNLAKLVLAAQKHECNQLDVITDEEWALIEAHQAARKEKLNPVPAETSTILKIRNRLGESLARLFPKTSTSSSRAQALRELANRLTDSKED